MGSGSEEPWKGEDDDGQAHCPSAQDRGSQDEEDAYRCT